MQGIRKESESLKHCLQEAMLRSNIKDPVSQRLMKETNDFSHTVECSSVIKGMICIWFIGMKEHTVLLSSKEAVKQNLYLTPFIKMLSLKYGLCIYV